MYAERKDGIKGMRAAPSILSSTTFSAAGMHLAVNVSIQQMSKEKEKVPTGSGYGSQIVMADQTSGPQQQQGAYHQSTDG